MNAFRAFLDFRARCLKKALPAAVQSVQGAQILDGLLRQEGRPGVGQGVPQIRAVSVDAQNAPEAFPEPGRGGGGGEAGLKHHARLHAGPGQRGQREKEGRSLGEGVQLPRTEGIEALSERPGPGAEACHGEDNEQNEDESQEKAA